MENKTKEYESPSATWASAVKELAKYLQLVRAQPTPEAEKEQEDPLYGAVCVGRYVRFYQLVAQETVLEDYPSSDAGSHLELKGDEAEIHKMLTEITARTFI